MLSCEGNLRKGPWSTEEDNCLKAYVKLLGERRWDAIAKATGLRRSGKSCRLRWLNYLCPNLKHSRLNAEEKYLILRLHQKWGNKWARISRRLPGRTDNEVKNYWRAYMRKVTRIDNHQINDKSDKSHVLITDDCTHNSSNLSSDEEGTKFKQHSLQIKDEVIREGLSSIHDQNVTSDVVNCISSPYEHHIQNWISMLSIDIESDSMGFSWLACCSSNGLENCQVYTDSTHSSNNLQSDTVAAVGSDVLWDMDLF